MTDLEQSPVLDVVANRTAEACQELWTRLGVEQSHKVEAVTIDMWEPYLSITSQTAPQAQIVHDKFHVAKHLNEAVDQVRRGREPPVAFPRKRSAQWHQVRLAKESRQLARGRPGSKFDALRFTLPPIKLCEERNFVLALGTLSP